MLQSFQKQPLDLCAVEVKSNFTLGPASTLGPAECRASTWSNLLVGDNIVQAIRTIRTKVKSYFRAGRMSSSKLRSVSSFIRFFIRFNLKSNGERLVPELSFITFSKWLEVNLHGFLINLCLVETKVVDTVKWNIFRQLTPIGYPRAEARELSAAPCPLYRAPFAQIWSDPYHY